MDCWTIALYDRENVRWFYTVRRIRAPIFHISSCAGFSSEVVLDDGVTSRSYPVTSALGEFLWK